MTKVVAVPSHNLQPLICQTGFKEGISRSTHTAILQSLIDPGQMKKKSQYAAILIYHKPYDTGIGRSCIGILQVAISIKRILSWHWSASKCTISRKQSLGETLCRLAWERSWDVYPRHNLQYLPGGITHYSIKSIIVFFSMGSLMKFD